MAKTVAKGSILYTPFYQETGWDFLDKYFEHKRLITMKGAHYDYESEKSSFHRRSGFDKVWKQVRQIESLYLKFLQNVRRFGNIHENL
jgi:hypothetical protein